LRLAWTTWPDPVSNPTTKRTRHNNVHKTDILDTWKFTGWNFCHTKKKKKRQKKRTGLLLQPGIKPRALYMLCRQSMTYIPSPKVNTKEIWQCHFHA
jgi:hypothetical protein